ncbi:hypothetical protein F4801DRAFT_352485 [Xylaria longipes]|nr:hypothetical protein F4801DRAFT_352485 [Xylaria longipes]
MLDLSACLVCLRRITAREPVHANRSLPPGPLSVIYVSASRCGCLLRANTVNSVRLAPWSNRLGVGNNTATSCNVVTIKSCALLSPAAALQCTWIAHRLYMRSRLQTGIVVA